jgi:hypothetical protein
VLSDSKVYFSLLRKLSSTSSDGVRSGNLDVRLPLVAFFLDDACMAFSRNLVSISLHCTDIVLLMCRLLDAGRS